jgi:hypothetical protein
MALFLAVALATLAVQGRRRGHYGPLLLGAAGTAGLLVGRFAVASDPLMYTGIAALIAASVWNAWPRRGGRHAGWRPEGRAAGVRGEMATFA